MQDQLGNSGTAIFFIELPYCTNRVAGTTPSRPGQAMNITALDTSSYSNVSYTMVTTVPGNPMQPASYPPGHSVPVAPMPGQSYPVMDPVRGSGAPLPQRIPVPAAQASIPLNGYAGQPFASHMTHSGDVVPPTKPTLFRTHIHIPKHLWNMLVTLNQSIAVFADFSVVCVKVIADLFLQVLPQLLIAKAIPSQL